MLKAKITALGCYTPPGVLTNQDLEKLVKTNDQWIMERVGIREQHIADASIATSGSGDRRRAMRTPATRFRARPELNTIIVCTVTPDMFFPFDRLHCTARVGSTLRMGFRSPVRPVPGCVYGLDDGARLIAEGAQSRSPRHRRRYRRPELSMTTRVARPACFSATAWAAMLIEPTENGDDSGFIDFIEEIDGAGGDFLKMPAGGSRMPASHETVDQRLHYVHQEGQQVFKYAKFREMFEVGRDLIQRNGLLGLTT